MKPRLILIFIFLFSFISGWGQVIDSIIIGTGGGFSGQRNIYKLRGGQAWKGKGILSYTYSQAGTLKKRKVKSINKEAKEILVDERPFTNPSNTYKFLEIYSQGKVSEYTWGESASSVSKEVQEFYNYIFTILHKVKFKPNEKD